MTQCAGERSIDEFAHEYHHIIGSLGTRALSADGDHSIDTLSGGEAKRLHIARALACDPDVLLLDEVNAGLDPESAIIVLSAILHGPTSIILAVLHDIPADPRDLGFTHELQVADGRVRALTPIDYE